MTRRVLIGTGVVVITAGGLLVASEATGRLDDIADVVGLDPKPLPDPGDTRILRGAAIATAGLLATVEATAAAHTSLELGPVTVIVRDQLAALGGGTAPPAATPPGDADAAAEALEAAFDVATRALAADAVAAGSAALVRVLASMSAGHAQSQQIIRGLR